MITVEPLNVEARSGAKAPIGEPMLRIEHVEKSFPATLSFAALLRAGGRVPRRRVLQSIDFCVGRGELFGLLGANGAGKTSLLKMLATLSIPDRGRITLDGVDVVREPLKAKRRIGLCTAEERSFYFRLTGRANLMFFGALAGLRGPFLRQRVEEVFSLVDLTSAIDRSFHSYSSGMRQRLTVARALLADPDVVFLDEPTRAVDPVHADGLRRLIRDELVNKRGKTIVLATNLLEEAWALCDRIAVIDRGTVVAIGSPESLGKALHERMLYRLDVDEISDAQMERLRSTVGVVYARVLTRDASTTRLEVAVAGDLALRALFAVLASDGLRLRAFRSIEPDPMEIFRHVTGGEAP